VQSNTTKVGMGELGPVPRLEETPILLAYHTYGLIFHSAGHCVRVERAWGVVE
jgi:hypothetical protein